MSKTIKDHSPIFNDTVMLATILPGTINDNKTNERRDLWWNIKNNIDRHIDKTKTPYSLTTKNYIKL